MDANLAEAAISGNVEFLRLTLSTCQQQPNNYYNNFQSHHISNNTYPYERDLGNIFHLAAWNAKYDFFQEAIHTLPQPLVHQLLSEPESNEPWALGWTPLHVAAKEGHLGIVKLILGFYGIETELEPKPWLALDSRGLTPLHLGLCYKREECALEIMSAGDMKVVCKMDDSDGNSVLFLAVENGCNRVALRILMSSSDSYSVSGRDGCTPLHFVTACSVQVFEHLLIKHPECINAVEHDQGYTVLHQWTAAGNLWPMEYLLECWDNKSLSLESKWNLLNLIYRCDKHGNNPFHVAANWQRIKIAQTLANIYKTMTRRQDESSSSKSEKVMLLLPWLIPDKNGESPLSLAINDDKEAVDQLAFLTNQSEIIDIEFSSQGKNELLFLAIEKRMDKAAEKIWDIQHRYGWSKYSLPGREIWHASLKYSEEVAIWVAEHMPYLISDPGAIAITLCSVSEVGASIFLEWMLKKNTMALKEAPLSWIKACEHGHSSTLLAFINNCTYFRELCLHHHDTPLHHIWFEGSQQYRDFLKIPIMSQLKNFQDSHGETPLHKAIREHNLLLTEVLLTTDAVSRSIRDKKRKTAMDLLLQACRESWEWDEMCKRNGIFIPGLQTTYFQDKTNLLEVRNTLSVVAALLATITFTAGFTLPGGVKSDSTGKATLANKAAFLAFLLADALALCCSMFVLVCLIWSMVCDYNRSLLLIDRSMSFLLLALYNTLVAFMTGVYVVIPRKSLWIAIVIIIIMSFIFIISFKRSITYKFLDKLNPVDKRYKDEIRYREEKKLLEQGEATT